MRGKRRRIVVWLDLYSRLKLLLLAAILVTTVVLLSFQWPAAKTWTHWTLPLSGKVIALDAGHGGPDGGASSTEGAIEKDINLAITLYLRDYLQQAGALVVMTREVDKDLADPDMRGLSRRKSQDLFRRVDFVKEKKADLLVSIHMNSFPAKKYYGAQTFYYPENHHENQNFAELVQSELKNTLENTNRVAKEHRTAYLLKAVTVPSVLIEVGFLSNDQEARLLATESYQKKVAAGIYRGILRYAAGEKNSAP